MTPSNCPCQSGNPYGECCGRYHLGTDAAPTAQILMRARYSAFVRGDMDFLLDSWHPRTRPRTLELDSGQRWYRLDIIRTSQGRVFDVEGTVEFNARFRQDGTAGQQHEVSRFLREQGSWFYLEALSLE